MYICPECNRDFSTEQGIQKHYLQCWRENHGEYKSKPAPRSEDINTRKINDDVASFFNLLNQKD